MYRDRCTINTFILYISFKGDTYTFHYHALSVIERRSSATAEIARDADVGANSLSL